jgi:aryl-alcohol dehydrogenase-like predicted oxidoreductase
MEYTTLGRTGLTVSVAGLGCGGFSRLGLSTGSTDAQAVSLVRLALDSGITLIDTAANYGTEGIVGQAVRHIARDSVVLTTKASVERDGALIPSERIIESLENSLRALETDYLDVFQLHGVPPRLYDYTMSTLAPVLMRERERGRFRFLGITEASSHDLEHEVLRRAAGDEIWDVVMVAHHMLHRTATEHLFPHPMSNRIGTLLMYAVRSMFARPELLQATMKELAASDRIPASLADDPRPLDFLIHPGGAQSLTDAAYRFARHEPGVDVVLFGTGSADHLRANIASILRPKLPAADVERLLGLFGNVSGVGLHSPSERRRQK